VHSFQLERASEGFASKFQPSAERSAGQPRPAVHVQIIAPSLLSWGLQRLIETAGTTFRLIGVSTTLADAMPLLERSAADIVLLDLDDGHDDARVAELSMRLGCNVLVLTCVTDDGLRARLLAAGARGIFYKHQSPGQLLKALESAGHGVLPTPALPNAPIAPIAPSPTAPVPRLQAALPEDQLAALTRKERETVATMVADASAPAKVIAARLGISEHTLRNHLYSIYSKLEVNGRLGLQALVRRDAAEWGRAC
jgi:two-component system, NarL family, nitrate/nitrite response regulator NarL